MLRLHGKRHPWEQGCRSEGLNSRPVAGGGASPWPRIPAQRSERRAVGAHRLGRQGRPGLIDFAAVEPGAWLPGASVGRRAPCLRRSASSLAARAHNLRACQEISECQLSMSLTAVDAPPAESQSPQTISRIGSPPSQPELGAKALERARFETAVTKAANCQSGRYSFCQSSSWVREGVQPNQVKIYAHALNCGSMEYRVEQALCSTRSRWLSNP